MPVDLNNFYKDFFIVPSNQSYTGTSSGNKPSTTLVINNNATEAWESAKIPKEKINIVIQLWPL